MFDVFRFKFRLFKRRERILVLKKSLIILLKSKWIIICLFVILILGKGGGYRGGDKGWGGELILILGDFIDVIEFIILLMIGIFYIDIFFELIRIGL